MYIYIHIADYVPHKPSAAAQATAEEDDEMDDLL